VEFHNHNSIAVLAFASDVDYPRLTLAHLARLRELLGEIRRSGLFRGVVIASNSKSFATGAELGEVSQLDGYAASQFAQTGQAIFYEIEHFPAPIVAAIRGFCLGGGLDLALACHARVASYDASFGHPGAALGLITGWGGSQRLPRLIGKPAALQILLSAERIPATQALSLGLVDNLVPAADVLEASLRYAQHVVTHNPGC
jgi:enoyl-CoA hydratase/carnithine racemase